MERKSWETTDKRGGRGGSQAGQSSVSEQAGLVWLSTGVNHRQSGSQLAEHITDARRLIYGLGIWLDS